MEGFPTHDCQMSHSQYCHVASLKCGTWPYCKWLTDDGRVQCWLSSLERECSSDLFCHCFWSLESLRKSRLQTGGVSEGRCGRRPGKQSLLVVCHPRIFVSSLFCVWGRDACQYSLLDALRFAVGLSSCEFFRLGPTLGDWPTSSSVVGDGSISGSAAGHWSTSGSMLAD